MGVVFLYERTPINRLFMKKLFCLATGLLALYLTPGIAQPMPGAPGNPPGTTFNQRLNEIMRRNANGSSQTDEPALTKFNLDFPGGTAVELVKAIEKATGKPLNVIISPDEKCAKAKLPPVKVTDMDVARLFNTLRENTQKYNENAPYHEMIYSEGFYTKDEKPTDNSLWTFSVYEKQSALTIFNLDFPGGTPAQLVKAIEKADGKPMNVVIPEADADTKLPPLKMDNVNASQLFEALEHASVKQMQMVTSIYGPSSRNYSTVITSYGFKTDGGQPTDNSVWYFFVNKPPVPVEEPPQKATRYFSLAAYLDRGFTVNDITTAIQTGWKLAGVTPVPDLNYHKETKLLIAYGEPEKLKTIEDVLKTLPQSAVSASAGLAYEKAIENVQSQVDQLKKQFSTAMSAPTNLPAEKSAK